MNETLSKQEYQYLKNIEKLEQLVEKQEAKLKEKEELEAQLIERTEVLEKEAEQNEALNEKQNGIIEELHADLNEAESNLESQQTAFKNELAAKDVLLTEKTKQIELLQSVALSDQDLLFFYACKADMILAEFFNQKKFSFSIDEIKAKDFPAFIIKQAMEEPLETGNFILSFSENLFKLQYKK